MAVNSVAQARVALTLKSAAHKAQRNVVKEIGAEVNCIVVGIGIFSQRRVDPRMVLISFSPQ